MIFDIKYHGGSLVKAWSAEDQLIACDDAKNLGFPMRGFKMRVEREGFEESTRVEFLPFDLDQNGCGPRPIKVGQEIINDHFPNIRMILNQYGLVVENTFHFKVVL